MPLNRAFKRFSFYLREYPDGNWIAEARKHKKWCLEKRAERELFEAKGFIKTKNLFEAKRSLKRILKNFPNSLCSGDAKKLLNSLEKRKNGKNKN
jgi:TolA-binding protein